MDQNLTERIFQAVLSCGHTITADEIQLRFNPNKPGHNALNQLHRRIQEIIDASGPKD